MTGKSQYFVFFQIACEYSRFSLLLAAMGVSPGETSATVAATEIGIDLHTDGVNQCLHNKSGCHGVPNVNLFDFMFLQANYGFSLLLFCERASEKIKCFFLKKNVWGTGGGGVGGVSGIPK